MSVLHKVKPQLLHALHHISGINNISPHACLLSSRSSSCSALARMICLRRALCFASCSVSSEIAVRASLALALFFCFNCSCMWCCCWLSLHGHGPVEEDFLATLLLGIHNNNCHNAPSMTGSPEQHEAAFCCAKCYHKKARSTQIFHIYKHLSMACVCRSSLCGSSCCSASAT